jgi:hypothetical protein
VVTSRTGLGPENECAGATAIVNDRLFISLERMLHKDYDRTFSIEKRNLDVSLEGLGAKTN